MIFRIVILRAALLLGCVIGFILVGFFVMPASTVHSDKVKSDTSLLKYFWDAVCTPNAVSYTHLGSVTFAISLAGVAIGSRFGDKLKEKAEIMGGLILIILGCKILIQHL